MAVAGIRLAMGKLLIWLCAEQAEYYLTFDMLFN
jgi:hypothetical protein